MSDLHRLLNSPLYLEAFGGYALKRIGITHPFDLVVGSREEVSARLGGDARALELVDGLMTSHRLSWGRVFSQEEKDELLAKVTEMVLSEKQMNSSEYSTNMHALAIRVYAFVGASREKYRVLADWWFEKKCYTDAIRAFQLSMTPEDLPGFLIRKGDAFLRQKKPYLYAAILFYEAAWGEARIPDEKVFEIGFPALTTHLGWRYLRLLVEKKDASLLARCAEWVLDYGERRLKQWDEESSDDPFVRSEGPPEEISNSVLALFLFRQALVLNGTLVEVAAKKPRERFSAGLDKLSLALALPEELRARLAEDGTTTLGHLVERHERSLRDAYGDDANRTLERLLWSNDFSPVHPALIV